MAPGRFERLDDSPPAPKRGTTDSSTLPSIMVPDNGNTTTPSGQIDYFAIKRASKSDYRRSNGMTPGDEIASLFTPSPSLFPLPPLGSSDNGGTNFFYSSTSDNRNNTRNITGEGAGAGYTGLPSIQTPASDQPLLQSPAPIYSPASSNGSFPGGNDDHTAGRPTSSMAPTVPTPKTTQSSKFGLQIGGNGNADESSSLSSSSENNKRSSSTLPPTLITTPAPMEPAYSPSYQPESAKTYTTFTGFRPFSIHSDTHSYIEGEEDDDFNDHGGGRINLAERGRISTGGTGISMKLRGDGVGAAEMARRARRRRKMCIGFGVLGGICAAAIVIGVVVGVVGMFMR